MSFFGKYLVVGVVMVLVVEARARARVCVRARAWWVRGRVGCRQE